MGRYLFTIQDSRPGKGLRPLRDPAASEEADDAEWAAHAARARLGARGPRDGW
ncbi:hypothetical protein [Streptomyces sp. NPDC050856]|uniref:hypothetical protein n=1 Tax=Streptomyces sp. NPDC050856 TaxID=3154939 RepID=UPI0033E9317F